MADLLIPLAQASSGITDTGITDAGKAIALGVGAGLGSIGAGIGIGIIFGKEIESVARQPEMKDELQSIRWLGFALTEAEAFYTFIFGLIAFFLEAHGAARLHSPAGGGEGRRRRLWQLPRLAGPRPDDLDPGPVPVHDVG